MTKLCLFSFLLSLTFCTEPPLSTEEACVHCLRLLASDTTTHSIIMELERLVTTGTTFQEFVVGYGESLLACKLMNTALSCWGYHQNTKHSFQQPPNVALSPFPNFSFGPFVSDLIYLKKMNVVIRSGQRDPQLAPSPPPLSSFQNVCGQTRHPALFCMGCDKLEDHTVSAH